MSNFVQSLGITIVGMVVVFAVLSIIAIIVSIQGKIFDKINAKKVVNNRPEKKIYSKDVSGEDPRVAVAISAALYAYNEEKGN